MTQPVRPQRPIARLKLTPDELDQAAVVTPVDVAMARNLWLQSAPPKVSDLLEAAPEAE